MLFGCRIYRSQSQPFQETTSLLARFHIAGRCYAIGWKRKVIQGLAHHWTLHSTVLTFQVRCTCNSDMEISCLVL